MALANRLWIFGLMVVMAALSQGCAHNPEMAERNVVVSVDDSVPRGTAVEVDLIGANDAEYDRVGKQAVDQYWRDVANNRYPPHRVVMRFGNERSKTLNKTDPIWQDWRNDRAMRLVAVGFIPGLTGSGEGQSDPRRVVIPLDKNRWKELEDIKITVRQSGLTATQPTKEP